MDRLKFTIEYEGTQYCGWQRQNNVLTIQQVIEEAIETITQEKINLVASGRTDRGVHAKAQIAHCKINTSIPLEHLQRGLNSILPKDIVIQKIEPVDHTFHAQLSAISKIYHYQIFNHKVPSALHRNVSWWIPHPLDVSKMNEAATLIVGKHDFKAFQNQGTPVPTTVKTIFQSQFKKKSPFLIYQVEGNGFLRQMVRNLVGAFVEIGRGRLTLPQFEIILASKDRKLAPKSAPPQGLLLTKVFH
ncbi:MAG: tRNA pseudouridine(38-40) synthase TruA [Deltaproteobacteria bacterium]|nr:tRNA pseudouridine(38-40) synthase TruA [Deltaproteobacteria bacterium]